MKKRKPICMVKMRGSHMGGGGFREKFADKITIVFGGNFFQGV